LRAKQQLRTLHDLSKEISSSICKLRTYFAESPTKTFMDIMATLFVRLHEYQTQEEKSLCATSPRGIPQETPRGRKGIPRKSPHEIPGKLARSSTPEARVSPRNMHHPEALLLHSWNQCPMDKRTHQQMPQSMIPYYANSH